MTITDPGETAVESAPTWWEEFYSRVDVFDPRLADDMLTEDTAFTMGNHPTTVGRAAFKEGVAHLSAIVTRMHHVITRVIEDGENATIEAVCEYTRKDESTVAIPVLTAIERRGGLVAAQRVYIDLAPLFATDKH